MLWSDPLWRKLVFGAAPRYSLAGVISKNSGQGGLFATTRWSVICSAGEAISSQTEQAREQLCRLYWPALYAWLRREGHSPADAEDLVQGFLARFLSRNDFAQARAERGRFRSYLLGGLRNYVISEGRRGDAAKRGGPGTQLSLEELRAEEIASSAVAPDLSAQQAFDRRWLATILAEALRRLEEDYVSAGQGERFHALKPWLTSDPPDGSYDALAEKLGTARPTIATWVSRLRVRYRDLVQAQIRDTVSTQQELEQEMRELLATL